MSGWQRIGVVISALWLIGFPIYLVQYSSMSERSSYQQCMNTHNPDLTTTATTSIRDYVNDSDNDYANDKN